MAVVPLIGKSVNDVYRLRRAMSIALLIALAISTWVGIAGQAQAVTINVTYTNASNAGFNDPALGAQRKTAFEAAVSQWAQTLKGAVPILIRASFDPLGGSSTSATLGQARAGSVVRDFQGAPQSSTWYPLPLADQFAGTQVDPGTTEIVAQFNSDIDGSVALGGKHFYYGTDGNAGSSIDFYSVVLHEMCHGLGFIAGINQDGSYLSGIPVVYDLFLANGATSNATLLSTMTQAQRQQALISNSLYFSGTNTRAAGGGVNARLYAPNLYEPGSSVSHLDDATYSKGPNSLMTPVISGVTHQAGPVATGVLQDIGWTFTTSSNPAPTVTSITPNSGLNNGSVSITNLAGTGFLANATVKLSKSGQSDIAATNVVVVSSTKITSTFDLTGKPTGQWDVVVTNTDGQSGTLAKGFTVNAPTVSAHDVALTVFTASPNPVSRGATLSFNVTVKNLGTYTENNVTFTMNYGTMRLAGPIKLSNWKPGQEMSGVLKLAVPRNQKTGDYLITGQLSTVAGETNTTNNSQTVKVTVK